MLTIRELKPEEWGRLAEVDQPFKNLPAPSVGKVVIAEDQWGHIRAFWPIQHTICAEPVYIDPAWRNTTLGYRMFQEVKKLIWSQGGHGFLVHSPDAKTGDYLERLGLERTGWEAFQGKAGA